MKRNLTCHECSHGQVYNSQQDLKKHSKTVNKTVNTQ